MEVQEAIAYMHKEAKAVFLKRVMRDIREQKSKKWLMRYKQDFLLSFRYYLAGYNKLAQKYNIPFGVLLYAEVHNTQLTYSWLNALNPNNTQRARLKEIANKWERTTYLATNHDRPSTSSEIVEIFKYQLTKPENT